MTHGEFDSEAKKKITDANGTFIDRPNIFQIFSNLFNYSNLQ